MCPREDVQQSLNGEFSSEECNGNGKLPCPFVKWAGGKRFLLGELESHLPTDFDGHFPHNYYEPFVGGGALFFSIHKKLETAYLSDSNFDLIITYKVIQKNPNELIEQLRIHENNHSKEYYKEIRADFEKQDPIEIAARFIYLNKTCYNGLWRVNKKGHFNVPMGSYKRPRIVHEKNILLCHEALKFAKIEVRDFETIQPKQYDFVYFDPPYHPRDDFSFKSYTQLDFTEKDQERLMKFSKKLIKSGVRVMLSNSNMRYINTLYQKPPFKIDIVSAPRLINCKPEGRDSVEEVIITSY